MVARTLQAAGLETLEANNGQHGLELLEKDSPHLIITDINMPVMDGLDFAHQLRQRPAHAQTPLIFLTTEAEVAHLETARDIGWATWLTKPLIPATMLLAVKAALPGLQLAS
jgi:two-component system chemotaxis response regulator CheY